MEEDFRTKHATLFHDGKMKHKVKTIFFDIKREFNISIK